MTLVDFGNLLIGVGITLLVVLVVAWYMLKRVNDQLEQQIGALLEKAQELVIGLNIEVDNDQYYVYNAKDNQFICQGKTAKDILDAFKERYPNKMGYLTNGDDVALQSLVEEFKKLKDAEQQTL